MRLCSVGVLPVTLSVFFLALAGSACATQRTDPQAGSPAGVIYQIPLDTGRRDAAPVLRVRSRSGGGSGSGSGGSGAGHEAPAASTAPSHDSAAAGDGQGAKPNHADSAQSATAAIAQGGASPSDPSSIHSENGFGSSSQVPGLSPAAYAIGAGVPAAHTPGSTLPSYLLMILVGLAAVAVGLIAGRGRGARG